MAIKDERHSGNCGFCQTSVPAEANVCTGCGAFWVSPNNVAGGGALRVLRFSGIAFGLCLAYFLLEIYEIVDVGWLAFISGSGIIIFALSIMFSSISWLIQRQHSGKVGWNRRH